MTKNNEICEKFEFDLTKFDPSLRKCRKWVNFDISNRFLAKFYYQRLVGGPQVPS